MIESYILNHISKISMILIQLNMQTRAIIDVVNQCQKQVDCLTSIIEEKEKYHGKERAQE